MLAKSVPERFCSRRTSVFKRRDVERRSFRRALSASFRHPKDGQLMNPSRTAEVMALFRALESRRSANERLFGDPIADSFLRPWARAGVSLGRWAYVRKLIERAVDKRWPGARTSAR